MKYKFLIENGKNKQGDIVDLPDNFWRKYYQDKGIIAPFEQLEIQQPPKKRNRKSVSKKVIEK